MGCQFAVDDEKKVLFLVYNGEVDLKERLMIKEKTLQHLREKRLKKLFVDATKCQFNMSTKEYFDFAFHSNEKELKPDSRIALLIKEFDLNNEFLARIAFNNGIIVNTFTDFEEALHWLD